MQFTRRDSIMFGMAALVATGLPLRARAEVPMVGELEEFTGGAEAAMGGVTLTAPEIAENGNTVPIEVDAPGATEIRVYAMGNPTPGVVAFTFGPLAAAQRASTRCRLAGTQEVVAVAKMADGSFAMDKKEVKVTIGGCGG